MRQLTSSTGAITDTYDYDAFGNKVNSTGTTPNSYLYRGEQFDTDLGLYYLRARYYNPATGRFMGRDPEDGRPTDPRTLHKYLYALGDPVNRLDPRGQASILETGSLDELIGTAPVPALTEFLGGSAAAITEWYVALDSAISQITLYLAEASADAAAGLFDAAAELIDEAIEVYDDLLVEESKIGGVVRYLACELVGLEGVHILEEAYHISPKNAEAIKVLGIGLGCAFKLEPVHIH